MPDPSVLLTGIAFGESPRWHEGRLWFCDWGTQEVIAVGLDGATEVMARVPATFPFSIDWLPDGRLLVMSGPEARLLRQEPDGSLVTHADLSGLAGGFNEIVVDAHGNVFVNGGSFDLMAGEPFKPGIVAVVTPNGEAREVADGIAFGNGMAVTPDDTTLIVAESYGKRLTAFDLTPNGTLSNRRVWADLGTGVPDGICMDAENTVWYADVPNKRCVRVREGGEVLRTIEFDQGCFACMLGGEDGTKLFMLTTEWRGTQNMLHDARTGHLLTTETTTPHAGRP